MNCLHTMMDNMEYLKNNELVPDAINNVNSVDTSGSSHQYADAAVESADGDTAAREREEQIERWMNDIKSFIRKIDISRL